jgi:hypothetical protein
MLRKIAGVMEATPVTPEGKRRITKGWKILRDISLEAGGDVLGKHVIGELVKQGKYGSAYGKAAEEVLQAVGELAEGL